MNNVMKQLSIAAVLSAGLVSTEALAFEAGDWVVRAGATQVNPQESSSPLALDGAILEAPLNGKLGVDSDTQLGLTAEYMLSNNWGIELLAATPFSHTATVTDANALQGLDVADVKHLPPTLSAVYHIDTGNNFKPYLGIGVNYTIFFEESITSQADAAFTSLGLTGGDVELDDSWGLSFQFGADYLISENWLLNASVRWIDIDTEAKVKFDNGSRVTSDVDVDPYVYTVSVGYKF